MSERRIYGKNVDIDSKKINEFWNKKAKENNTIKSVLCGSQNADSSLRNENELAILSKFLDKDKKLKIFDIGCGIGRWASNLKDFIETYHGIDFSNEFVKNAKNNFAEDKEIEFFQMSATSLNKNNLLKNYDLVIMTGVLTYINDNDLIDIFNNIKSFNPRKIYLQESVSIINSRLTLKDFYSNDLQVEYNAVYRTVDEYKTVIMKVFEGYELLESNLFLNEKTGAREETNAQYWFLQKA